MRRLPHDENSIIFRLMKIVHAVQSKTAIETVIQHHEVDTLLWGGKFWTSSYYINTIGMYGNAMVIEKYVKNQCKEYKQKQRKQLTLF